MLKKQEKKQIYTKYLKRLWDKKYLTNARKGLLSEAWARRYNRKLKEEGFVLFNRCKAGKKFAEFSTDGVKFLQDYGVLDKDLNVIGFSW